MTIVPFLKFDFVSAYKKKKKRGLSDRGYFFEG